MTRTLIFLGLLVFIEAQLIYPDQYEQMRTSQFPTYTYSSTRRQYSNEYPTSYQQAAYSKPAPTIALGAYAAPALASEAYTASASAPIVNPLGQAMPSYPEIAPQINTLSVVPQISPLAESLPHDWAYRVNDIISKGVTKLALDVQNVIYNENVKSVKSEKDNIVFSPLNIAGTLALVHLGSAGVTFDEISRILGLAVDVDISTHSELVHQIFGLLMSIVHEKVFESSRTIDLASGIFLQEGFPIRPEFKAISESVYQSEVLNLDFQQRGKEAQDRINAWVREKTSGKISNLLSEEPASTTNMIIASALYFKAEWNKYFLPKVTKKMPFFIEPDQQTIVNMMYNGADFPFYEDKNLGVKILGLPYKGLDTTMYVLLPTAQGARALGDFARTLTPETIEYLIRNMINQTCIIAMPRMKISSTLKLRNVLQSLGLTSLFNAATADLSLLSPGLTEQNKLAANTIPPPTVSAPTVSAPTRPGKSNIYRDQLVFSRFGEEEQKPQHGYRRHYFKYLDNTNGYNIEQWATGFNIKKLQRKRREINMENENETTRVRRQSRPVSKDFLEIVVNRNFSSYGLDNLRNTGTLTNPRLYATEVLHKVEMEINEKGTEASAVTVVFLERDGRQKRFIANRPFIFFIRHNPTKLILFWSMINTPTPNFSTT